MAEPRQVQPSGAKSGFNARISNAILGSIDVRVATLSHGITINSEESSAAQAKTFYPQKVSDAPFSITLLHRTKAERNKVNDFLRNYMERASSNRLTSAYLRVSVPSRRFLRLGVLEGTLRYGDSVTQRGRIYTTDLTFIASSNPADRSDLSRVLHSEDWEILSHYPSGQQAGWSTESSVYDSGDRGQDPVIRPGQPNRPV